MPYIKQEDRPVSGTWQLGDLADKVKIKGPGFANFIITTFLSEAYSLENPSYSKINEAIGVLECVKLELYRRIAVPYEDEKILENGDVYCMDKK